MKVWLGGQAHQNSGGMYRVYKGLYDYLPIIGIEIVDDVKQADVLNPHIGLFQPFPPNIPMVVSSHGLLWSEHGWGKFATKVNRDCLDAYRRADVVTAPSRFAARAIARYTGASPVVARHGINTEEWLPGVDEGYVIWNKARIDPANDPKEMNQLADLAPDIMFYSTYGKETDNVYTFGRIPANDMHNLVSKAGVYLDTSKESGGPCFGILEAMSCAVPTLSWNFGGTTEVIVHQETGYLAEPYDYDDLLNGLFYCIENRDRLGANARQHAIDQYQWKDVIGSYKDAYELALYPKDFPTVSVIVPCHNLGRFLPHCLDSIISQSYPNWEVIVIDDASSDNTWEIINDYSFKDSRIIGRQNTINKHVSETRNYGIDESLGKYILPLDADDRLFPGALELMVDALDNKRSLDIVAGKLRIFHESDLDGKSIDSGWPNGTELKLQLEGHNRLPYASMYRRKVWERVGGYRRRIRCGVEDADFWTRALSYGYNAEILPSYTLKYTQRDSSLGKQNTKGAAAWLSWFPWNYLTSPAITEDVKNFDPPTVSVVIPVGPGHTYHLQACIDSLIAQTESSWEAVVINDTGERWFDVNNEPLTHYVLGMGFVKFIDGDQNRGVAWARNRGVEEASSNNIVFLDVDDVAQPHMLQALLAAHSLVDGWVYGDWYINVDGKVTYSEAEDWAFNKIINKSLAPITGLYRKDHIQLVGGFDETLAGWEDWDFQLKLVEQGICGTRLKTGLITYNMHLGHRREDNFRNKKSLLQYINERYSKLREVGKEMACRSCGGRGTLTIKQKSSSGDSITMDDVVELIYLGDNSRERIRSKTHHGTTYLFSANKREFGVFASDVQEFMSMRLPGTNSPKFKIKPKQPVATKDIVLSEEPLVSEDVSQEVPTIKKPSVDDLLLDSRIIKLLSDNGFENIHDLMNASDDSLLAIRGVGEARVKEIREAVIEWNTRYSTW